MRENNIEGKKRLALIFPYDINTINLIKHIDGRKWSASNKFWHIPYEKNSIIFLNKKFKGKLEFKEQEIQKKIEKPKFPAEYIETLKLKNYSEVTIKTYKLHFQRFLNYYPEIKLENIKHEQIRKYLLYLVQDKHYSTSAQNQAINSIKFYYEKVLGKPVEKYYVPRPRKEKKLPEVLSEEEVTKILKQITNLKHQCIIYLIYPVGYVYLSKINRINKGLSYGVNSAGLRLTEVVHLKISDIQSDRKQIFVRSAKGSPRRIRI